MRRRHFIALVGGATIARLHAANAQQFDKPRLIGALLGFASDDAEAQNRLAAFRKVLQGLGWTEGRNARIEVRWTGDDPEHRKDYPAELITLAPGVIFCSTNFALAEVSR